MGQIKALLWSPSPFFLDFPGQGRFPSPDLTKAGVNKSYHLFYFSAYGLPPVFFFSFFRFEISNPSPLLALICPIFFSFGSATDLGSPPSHQLYLGPPPRSIKPPRTCSVYVPPSFPPSPQCDFSWFSQPNDGLPCVLSAIGPLSSDGVCTSHQDGIAAGLLFSISSPATALFCKKLSDRQPFFTPPLTWDPWIGEDTAPPSVCRLVWPGLFLLQGRTGYLLAGDNGFSAIRFSSLRRNFPGEP